MARGIDKLRKLINDKNLDVLLIRSKTNKKWIDTLTGSGCFLLITKDDCLLLVDGRYIAMASSEHDFTVVLLDSQSISAFYSKLEQIAKDRGWNTIGVEGATTNASSYLVLNNIFDDVVLLDDEIDRCRMVKTPLEIKKIQQAVELGDDCFLSVLDKIKPYMTENEISALLSYEAISRGAQKMSFDTIIASGTRTCLPHGRPTSKKILPHEHIMIDFGVQLDNYQSDMTRIVFLGDPKPEIMDIYNCVLTAQKVGVQSIVKGAFTDEIDGLVRGIIDDFGYGDKFVHGLGHGIGVDCGCDLPLLRQGSRFRVDEGMVMSCEPGVYIEGVGGVRIEDDVAVIDGVGKALNSITKDPIILEV